MQQTAFFDFMRRHYKLLTLLFVVLVFIIAVVVYLASQPKPLNIDTSQPQSTESGQTLSTGQNTFTSDKLVGSNTETMPDDKTITGALMSDPSKADYSVKAVSTKKEIGAYRLVEAEIHDAQTNQSYIAYVIIKNGQVITGVSSDLSMEELQGLNVPAEIINAYEEELSDY